MDSASSIVGVQPHDRPTCPIGRSTERLLAEGSPAQSLGQHRSQIARVAFHLVPMYHFGCPQPPSRSDPQLQLGYMPSECKVWDIAIS